MKEPKRIPLTDNPRIKEPNKIPLQKLDIYDIEMNGDDLWNRNENNKQNNSQSISNLESDSSD